MFDDVVSSLDFPMHIVTVASGGEADGCLVGFGTQASIDPFRYLVLLSEKNRTYRLAQTAEHLMVHLPAPESEQMALVRLFGEETGDEVDKLSRCEWRPGPDGVTPVLEACPRWLLGRVLERIPLGDHTGFLLEPVAGEPGPPDAAQVGFQMVKDLDPGHDP